jgi:hypothetical protein
MDDFLIVTGAVAFVCFSALGWAYWSLPARKSKRRDR